MIQYAKSRICGQYSVDTMNLVYYRMSSCLFVYLPLLSEPSVNAHCTGIYGEGLYVGLLRTWFRRLPVMRSAVGG